MRLIDDVRLALRQLAGRPGFSLAAIAMLTLGIGFSVAMYSTVQGVLLRGLPFPDGERVVTISARQPAQHVDGAQLSIDEAERIAAGTPGFAAIGYYWWSGVTLFDGEHAREITTHVVGDGYFAALGVEALLGRRLDAADIREDRRVAVLSYEEWQHGFGGDPSVIGRRLDLVDEEPLEVVGVMPPALALFAGETGLWRPLSPVHFPTDGSRRAQRMLLAIGRLAPDTSLAQADAALTARLADPQASIADPTQAWQGVTRRLIDALIGDARGALWGAFALAVLVLLIAAVNVAILLDARQAARRRELAVRQALGASRATLGASLLIELALLAGAGVALGLALAAGAIELLRGLAAESLPRVEGIVVDRGVAAFAVVLGVTVPLLAALAGALRIQAAPAEAIRGGAKGVLGAAGGRRVLPILAMALSTASLIAALTLAAGLWRLQRVDPGFDASGVQVMQFFRVGKEAFVPFTERLLEQLEALPGVEAAALTSAPPRSGIGSASVELDVAARPDAGVQAALRRVSPGYRSLLDVPLLAGRDLDGGDRRGTEPVALLNRTAAHRLFGEGAAVGQMVGVPIRGTRVAARVVGVVEDIRNDGLRSAPAPEILVPFAQQPINAMAFLVRSRVAGTGAAMAGALAALDPRQAITRNYALAAPIDEELAPARFFARTVGAFAAAALLLAVLGIYAVAALRQRRRVGEFGLRLAIGARPRDMATDVLRDGLALSVIGVAAGLALAVGGLRLLDLSAVGVAGGTSPAILATGVAAMVLAALGALGLPAWRAARVPPMEALRSE